MSWYVIAVVIVGSPVNSVMPPGKQKMIGSLGTEQACTQAAAEVRRNHCAMGIKNGLTLQCEPAGG